MIDDPQETSAHTESSGPEMSISEHLNELRSRLIRALIGVGIALVACLFYQDEIMQVITRPHRKAMERLEEKLEEGKEEASDDEPTEEEMFAALVKDAEGENPKTAAVLEMIGKKVFNFEDQGRKRRVTLQAIKYQEAFISYLKASIVAALLLASPWILLQLWSFVGAGLYTHERRYVLLYLPFSFLAFGCGVAFGYFVLIPEGLSYLATYANPELVSFKVTLEFYLSLFLLLTLALGLVFQLPLVMMFLARARIFTPKEYAKHRKYFLLTAVILGAVLTPPDPVTQILLASPMFLLYELGIWLSRITARRQKEA